MSRAGPHVQRAPLRTSWGSELESSLHLGDVIRRLSNNESIRSVAIWLHSVDLFKDMSVGALQKAISRWWESRPGPVDAAPEVIEDLIRLEQLAALQQERINLIVGVEKSAGMLMPSTRQEFTEQRMLLHTIIEKKQSLGLLGKRPDAPSSVTQVHVDNRVVHVVDSGLAARVTAVASNPESRRRVLSAIESLTQPKGDVDANFEKRFQVGDRSITVERAAANG